MIKIYLLSRRDPAGPWMIRNRFGSFRPNDTAAIARAKNQAQTALAGWANCGIEGSTEFMVSEETS